MKGKFIAFEGVDGCGKTTLIEGLRKHLVGDGYEVTVVSELSGDNPLGSAVRPFIVTNDTDGLTKLLAIYAARRESLEKVVAPALAKGHVVLYDRFSDSTMAYQYDTIVNLPAGARAAIDVIHNDTLRIARPDMGILLHCDAREAARRIGNRGGPRDEFDTLDHITKHAMHYLQMGRNPSDRLGGVESPHSWCRMYIGQPTECSEEVSKRDVLQQAIRLLQRL